MLAQAPPDIRALVERREAARQARDFELADRLRAQIEAAGWVVIDGSGGPTVDRSPDGPEVFPTYASVPGSFHLGDTCEFSLCVVLYGWPEDVRRMLAACASDRMELIAVDVGDTGAAGSDLQPEPGPGGAAPIRVLSVKEKIGHAQAWNVAARRARGRIVVFVDPSLEFATGALEALGGALEDDAVSLVGPFGLSTNDMRDFEPDDGPEVAALEYMLAIRRADVSRLGELDTRFRFYRNLDIDFSFQVRAAGGVVRRIDCGDVIRHQHRVWEATPPDERERLSRRNFNRFLDRWQR